jgi:hypothetical protein
VAIGGAPGPWTPPGALNAKTNGTFYDIPVGQCAPGIYSSWTWSLQDIYIVAGNTQYYVGYNYWTSTATAPDTGSLTNVLGNNTGNVAVSYP